jgi:hypothetical protein
LWIVPVATEAASQGSAVADSCRVILVMRDLFEAYDEACIALENFRYSASDDWIIEEYEATRAELEADIVREL